MKRKERGRGWILGMWFGDGVLLGFLLESLVQGLVRGGEERGK